MNTTAIKLNGSSKTYVRGLLGGTLAFLIGTSACGGVGDVETSSVEDQTSALRNQGRTPEERACDDKLGDCYIDCSVTYPDNPNSLNDLLRQGCEDSCDAAHRFCVPSRTTGSKGTTGVTGDRYVVDLSKDSVLQFDAADVRADLTRVTIRTAAGESLITALPNDTFTTRAAREGFYLGTASAMAGSWGTVTPVEPSPRGLSYTCVDKYCDCTGAADCGAMVLSGECGTWVACTSKQCICERKK